MWHDFHTMNWPMVLWMTLVTVGWVSLTTFLVYSMASGWPSKRRDLADRGETERALGIANRRYASGELSEDDYKRIRENLR